MHQPNFATVPGKFAARCVLVAIIGGVLGAIFGLGVPFPGSALRQAAAVEIGAEAPDFEAVDINGTTVKLSQMSGKTVILEWFNYGCPFVRKHYDSSAMQALQKEFVGKGIVWLTINSTGTSHRDYKDAAETQALMQEKAGASSHVILDSAGTVGKLYQAKTTPHVFIIDQGGKLAYQGAIDDAPAVDAVPSESRSYAREVLEALQASKPAPVAQSKPYGCSIKYAG